jgi:uncharacterized Zn-binding protein involved in type VI secretion
MPNFPAVTMGSMVIGMDVHAQIIPPGVPTPVPCPYAGPIFMWMSPKFPMANVFINGKPACAVGAMGYSMHIPTGAPVLPANTTYWTRYLTHVAMGITLAGLTVFANMAIAAISAMIPKPPAAADFIKDVTGIDASSTATFLSTASASFASFTQWQTWAKLLLPPLPFPGSQGSTAVGSPTVTVNGGPMAFVGPMNATSCSDIPIVPNASTLGFSNVFVGISVADLIRGIAVSVAQSAIQTGLSKGVEKMTSSPNKDGKKDCGCSH